MSRISTLRGEAFENAVAETLLDHGWRILERRPEIEGIEVDLMVLPPGSQNGRLWFIECKGGEIPERSGLARTDTTKKTLGTAWALRRSPAIREGVYFVVTSMMPSEESLSHQLLTDGILGGLLHGVGTIESLLGLNEFLNGNLPGGGFTMRPSWGQPCGEELE